MQIKLVIIQSDSLEARVTAERFTAYGCKVLAIGSTGEQALSLCRELKPDALVMEPFLPGLNCDEITEQLEQKHDLPLVKVVLSSCKNDAIANRFFNSGGDLFFLTPVDYSYCVRQVTKFLRLRRHESEPVSEEVQIRGCTKKILIRMRMPMTIHGFVYVLDAVEYTVQDQSLLHNLVYGLYPSIGKVHHKPFRNVERCIRTAVEQTFERGDMEYLFPRFGHAIRERTGKPTNGDFISILTELVREDLHLKECSSDR